MDGWPGYTLCSTWVAVIKVMDRSFLYTVYNVGAEGHGPPRGCAHRVLSLIPCLVRNGAMCCDV